MFRINVKEKFAHVMSRLQFLLKSNWKHVSPLPIPDMVLLENMSSDLVVSLNLAEKLTSKYEVARLTLALTLKMGDAGTIHLIGIGSRYWKDPTLSFDQAMAAGMTYKGFQVDFAHATSSGTMPGRFSNLSETVQISITYLQQQLPAKDGSGLRWCNYILSLPQKYNRYSHLLGLPNWFSDQCIEGIIQEIKESRKLVNIAQPGEQEKATAPKLPLLEYRDESGYLSNVDNITLNFNKVVIKDGKNEQNDHNGEGRNGNQTEEARAMRNSKNYLGARRKNFEAGNEDNLLDNSVPSMPSQELLMPRHISPPRHLPTAPQFPAQPYPWQHLAENPGWSRHQQQQSVQVDWHDFAGLQEQMKEQVKFAELQENIEKAIDRRTTNRRENLYEEINDKAPPTIKPLYHFEMPNHYKHVFEKPPMTSTPARSQSSGFKEAGKEQETPRDTERSLETTSWSGLSFLGPRFPSLPPSSDDTHAPRVEEKRQIESLRQITENELKTITNLEGEIHESIYGTRTNQAPCSLLTDHQVMAASQCPSLLPGSLKERIQVMHQVLEMMQKTKNNHIDTLKYLQERGTQHVRAHEPDDENDGGWDAPNDNEEERRRISARLAGKSKHDYNQLNRRGFQEY